MGKEDALPFAILDSDTIGDKFAKDLKAGLYSGDKDRVLNVGAFISVPNAEIEDLFPPSFLAKIVDRYLPKPIDVDEDFTSVVKDGEAIVPQIEAYAHKHNIDLVLGWKVDVAKRAKAALLKGKDDSSITKSYLEAWQMLFGAVNPAVSD